MTSVNVFPDNPDEVVIRQDPPARVVQVSQSSPQIVRTNTGTPGRDGVNGTDGTPGAPGVNGTDGRDAVLTNAAYEHVQVTVSDDWYIKHNLGYRPQVSAFDSGGTAVEGDVETLNVNELRLHFSSAFAGGAYLS